VTSTGVRILGVADSDSYLKWGAAALAKTPDDWDATMVVVETPVLPTEAQRLAAVDGLSAPNGADGHHAAPAVVSLAELGALVEEQQPDAVFLSLRGPLIRVVIREVIANSRRRPVFVSGLPGISIPATRKALAFRSQVDLIVLHSSREIREFTQAAERLKVVQRFGLATLPFLGTMHSVVSRPSTGSGTEGVRSDVVRRDELVFAAQATVPRTRADRIAIVEWLAESARRHPELRVVIKLRAVGDEKQTHEEHYPYDALLAEIEDAPANLVTGSGSMSAHLARAVGLVTVSSTALIEAVALGVPGIALDDFGVGRRLINTVFEDSGLFGSSEDLIAARFRHPHASWLDDNYFHEPRENDWMRLIRALAAERELAEQPLKRQRFGRAGGPLRNVWDRKRALGNLDTSVSGYVALVIGYPARATYRTTNRMIRRTRRAIRQLRRFVFGQPLIPIDEQDPSGLLVTLPRTRSIHSSSNSPPRVP
jgi:hypothetical protein